VTADPQRQLTVYHFAPGASFEGQLVGALERAEADGVLRVVEVLFVGRDAETGEVVAIDERAGGGGFAAAMLGFRLDERERRNASRRALDEDRLGTASVLVQIAETLPPGEAIAAVLIEQRAVAPLPDAVQWAGGSQLARKDVEAGRFAEVSGELLAAARAVSRP
jgi:hypothetical protein